MEAGFLEDYILNNPLTSPPARHLSSQELYMQNLPSTPESPDLDRGRPRLPFGKDPRSVPFGYAHPKAESFRTYLALLEMQSSRGEPVVWTLEYPPLEVYRVGYGLRVSELADKLDKSQGTVTSFLRGIRVPPVDVVKVTQDLTSGLLSRDVWDAWLSSEFSPAAKEAKAKLSGEKATYTKLHRVQKWTPSDARRRGRPPGSNKRTWDPLRIISVSLPESLSGFISEKSSQGDQDFKSFSAVAREAIAEYAARHGYHPPERPSDEEFDRFLIDRKAEQVKKKLSVPVDTLLIDVEKETPIETQMEVMGNRVVLPEPPLSFLSPRVQEESEDIPAPVMFPHNYLSRPTSIRYSLPSECEVEYNDTGHLVFKKTFIDPGWIQTRDLSPIYKTEHGDVIHIDEEGVEVITYSDGGTTTAEQSAIEAIQFEETQKKLRELSVVEAPAMDDPEVVSHQKVLDREFSDAEKAAKVESFEVEELYEAAEKNAYNPMEDDPEYPEVLDKARAALIRGDEGLDVLDRLCSAGVELQDITELFHSLSLEVPR